MYESGLFVAFCLWLFQAVYLVVLQNSTWSGNLRKVGKRLSWLSAKPIPLTGSYLAQPLGLKVAKYAALQIVLLPFVLLSWLSVAVSIAALLFQLFKGMGKPQLYREFAWKMKNVDMTFNQIVREIARSEQLNASEALALHGELLQELNALPNPRHEGTVNTTGARSKSAWWIYVLGAVVVVALAKLLGIASVAAGLLVFCCYRSAYSIDERLIAGCLVAIGVSLVIGLFARPLIDRKAALQPDKFALAIALTNSELFRARSMSQQAAVLETKAGIPAAGVAVSREGAHPATQEIAEPAPQASSQRNASINEQVVMMDRIHPGWREKMQSQGFQGWLQLQGDGTKNAFATADSAKQLDILLRHYDQWAIAQLNRSGGANSAR